MINNIKSFARKNLPEKLYSISFILYKKIIKREKVLEKDIRFSNFKRAGFYNFKLEEISFPIFLNPNNGGVDYEIFADGVYEPYILNLIKNSLGKDSVFIDIGANIGQHSLYASFFCKEVFSFEPIEKIYNQMNISVHFNDIFNIRTLNYALGSQKEILPIYSSDINVGASSLVSVSKKKKIQDIKVFKLDDIHESLCIENCDLIKIDVEGFEYNVMLGAKDFIRKFKPKIILEYSPLLYREFDANISTDIFLFLKGLDYNVYDIGSGEKLELVEDFKRLLSIDQTNLFCVSRTKSI